MAGRGEGGSFLKLSSDQFPYRVSRQAVGEGHDGRDLVGGEMLPAPGQKFLFGRLGPGRQDNESLRHLFAAGFRDCYDSCVGDRRVAEENPFYVTGVHNLPVADEAVSDPADDPDVPVLVGARYIPRPKPSVRRQRRGRLGRAA